MSTAMKVRSDVATDSYFFALGRRSGNIQRYHKLSPRLFSVSAENAFKLAQESGSKFDLEKFFLQYAESFQ